MVPTDVPAQNRRLLGSAEGSSPSGDPARDANKLPQLEAERQDVVPPEPMAVTVTAIVSSQPEAEREYAVSSEPKVPRGPAVPSRSEAEREPLVVPPQQARRELAVRISIWFSLTTRLSSADSLTACYC